MLPAPVVSTPPIGTQVKQQIEVLLCAECGGALDYPQDLCTYGCRLDGGRRPEDKIIVLTYQRLDTLISKREFSCKVPT